MVEGEDPVAAADLADGPGSVWGGDRGLGGEAPGVVEDVQLVVGPAEPFGVVELADPPGAVDDVVELAHRLGAPPERLGHALDPALGEVARQAADRAGQVRADRDHVGRDVEDALPAAVEVGDVVDEVPDVGDGADDREEAGADLADGAEDVLVLGVIAQDRLLAGGRVAGAKSSCPGEWTRGRPGHEDFAPATRPPPARFGSPNTRRHERLSVGPRRVEASRGMRRRTHAGW